jgi:hypothetical protein
MLAVTKISRERTAQLIQHLQGYRPCVLGPADGGNENKLVATAAPQGIGFANHARQTLGNALQQHVSLGMSQTVINGLEAVQIDVEDADNSILTSGKCNGLLEPVFEKKPIRQAGQQVVMRLERQALF